MEDDVSCFYLSVLVSEALPKGSQGWLFPLLNYISWMKWFLLVKKLRFWESLGMGQLNTVYLPFFSEKYYLFNCCWFCLNGELGQKSAHCPPAPSEAIGTSCASVILRESHTMGTHHLGAMRDKWPHVSLALIPLALHSLKLWNTAGYKLSWPPTWGYRTHSLVHIRQIQWYWPHQLSHH